MARRTSEAAAYLKAHPFLGKAHRRGRGLLDSHPKLSQWANEFLELHQQGVPNIGPASITRALRDMAKAKGLPVAAEITHSHVRVWWRRATGQE